MLLQFLAITSTVSLALQCMGYGRTLFRETLYEQLLDEGTLVLRCQRPRDVCTYVINENHGTKEITKTQHRDGIFIFCVNLYKGFVNRYFPLILSTVFVYIAYGLAFLTTFGIELLRLFVAKLRRTVDRANSTRLSFKKWFGVALRKCIGLFITKIPTFLEYV